MTPTPAHPEADEPGGPAGSAGSSGRVRLASTEVHWRMGTSSSPHPHAVSTLARQWLADLVTDGDLFEWRGLEATRRWSKPRPAGDPEADVSISHCGTMIVVAVCRGARVGVDVERAASRAFDSTSLRRRMCTPDEAARADALEPDARRRYLARVWTAKEAATKAHGTGLGIDLRSLSTDVPRFASEQLFEAHLAVIERDGLLTTHRLTQ